MEITNKKKYFDYYKVINNKNVVIGWDYTPIKKQVVNGGVVETPLATWQQHYFDYIPSLKEIQDVILEYYNKEINEEIYNGCIFNGMKVWLSLENQLNYKVMYDLTYQTNGKNLPVTLKLGDSDNPIYYDLKTIDDVSIFYLTTVNHIQETLKKGWLKKDSINWDNYKK